MNKVKCPNNCKIETSQVTDCSWDGKIVDKEIEFITGKTSTRNYCCKCGSELEEVDFGFRVVKFSKKVLPRIFEERDVATEVTKGLPKDAELADISLDNKHLNLYFKSTKWEQTDLDKRVKEIELEFTDHSLEEVETDE